MDTIVIAGSRLNHRSFKENESWNSILVDESKILAGNVLNETEYSESESYEDDKLNMNIDAISDDEVFFDCLSSPKATEELRSPIRNEVPHTQIQSKSQHLSINMAVSLQSREVTTSDERTGLMLVQVCEELKDMKIHAKSTSKMDSDIGMGSYVTLESTRKNDKKNTPTLVNESCNCKKKIDSHNVDTSKVSAKSQKSLVNNSTIRNYLSGKYFKKPYTQKETVLSPKVKTPVKKPIGRVVQIKESFENRTRLNEKSSNVTKAFIQKSTRVNKSSIEEKSVNNGFLKSRKVIQSVKSCKTHTSKNIISSKKSPSKQPKRSRIPVRTSKKINFSPKIKSGHKSGTGSSLLLRNQPNNYLRPSSCSEFPSEIESPCPVNHRSKSTSDMSIDSLEEIHFKHIMRMSEIMNRNRSGNNTQSRLVKKSPKKVSDIVNIRKSIIFGKSPPKPVREIRKMFSPSNNIVSAMESKVSRKNLSSIPRIIINK